MEVLLLSLLRSIITYGESGCLPGKDDASPGSELFCVEQFLPHAGALASETEDICFPSHSWCRERAAWLPSATSGQPRSLLLDSSQAVGGCATPAALFRADQESAG